jgi:hypothetical protein
MSSNAGQLIERGATLRQIREELLGIFGHLLGNYRLPDGTCQQAFWVVGEGRGNRHRVPPEWKVEGIECTLNRRPEREHLGGLGSLVSIRHWTLTFVSYNPELSLESIDLLIYRAFPTSIRRARPPTDEMFEQLIVEISDPVTTRPFF